MTSQQFSASWIERVVAFVYDVMAMAVSFIFFLSIFSLFLVSSYLTSSKIPRQEVRNKFETKTVLLAGGGSEA